MQLDVESLRVLLAVLETGGMTNAARQLHMSQSAVSRKVSRLEAKAGQPLLIREGHSLRPTRAARELIPDAQAIVERHDAAVARLESSDLEGKVTMGSNGEVDMSKVASILGAFRRRHPAIEVEFSIDPSPALAERVHSGEVDVALIQVSDRSIEKTDIVLWSDDLVFVTNACEDFSKQPIPFLDFDCCFFNKYTHAAMDDAGIEFKTVFTAATSANVREAVRAGLGVAAMNARYLGDDVVEWTPPTTLHGLPGVHQVLRTAPGEHSEVIDALVETIRDNFLVTSIAS